MTWELWIVVFWLLFATLVTIGSAHSKASPTTPALAVLQTCISLALIALVFMGASHV